MKLNRILLFTTVMLMVFTTSAQTLKQGKPISDKVITDKYNEPIGIVDGNLFFMDFDTKTYSTSNVSLLKINKDLKLEFKKELDFVMPNLSVYNVHIYNKKIYLLYSDPDLTKMSFNYQVFDLNGTPLENGEVGKIYLKDNKISNNKSYSISPNGQYSVIVMSGRKNRSEDLSLIIMKIDLGEKVTATEYTTDIDFKEYKASSLERISIDNNGKFVGIVEKRRAYDDVETETELIILDENAKLLTRQEIAAKGYFFKEFMLNINELNEVKLAGNYYSKKDKTYYLNGFFIANYDMDELEFDKVNFKPLSGDILSIYGEPNKSGQYENFSGKFEVKNYNNDDGSGFIVAERISIPAYKFQMELIVIPYNVDNEFEDFVFVPKNQRYNPKYINLLTYFAFTHNNKLNIYYNSDARLLKSKNAITMNYIKSADSKVSGTFKCVISKDSQRDLSVFANYASTKEYLDVEKCYSIDGKNVLTMKKDDSIIYGIFE